MQPNELFLSYSSLDHAFASSIVSVLRQHVIPVWHSETNLIGAQQWHDEIGAALRRCDWFALLLSPNATASMWVKRELRFALDERRFEGKILPLLYQSCDLDDHIIHSDDRFYRRLSHCLSHASADVGIRLQANLT
jgi:hypothetical protein